MSFRIPNSYANWLTEDRSASASTSQPVISLTIVLMTSDVASTDIVTKQTKTYLNFNQCSTFTGINTQSVIFLEWKQRRSHCPSSCFVDHDAVNGSVRIQSMTGCMASNAKHRLKIFILLQQNFDMLLVFIILLQKNKIAKSSMLYSPKMSTCRRTLLTALLNYRHIFHLYYVACPCISFIHSQLTITLDIMCTLTQPYNHNVLPSQSCPSCECLAKGDVGYHSLSATESRLLSRCSEG